MKRGIFILMIGIFLISLASAKCSLDVSLINQDPDPVMPGNYVEVVFQMSGVDNSDCEGAIFEISPEYPFSLDKNESRTRTLQGSTYLKDYKKTWNIPFDLRVDKDALEGENPIKIKYSGMNSPNQSRIKKEFNISVEDVRADFEIYVKDFNPTTKEITFEILNIGEEDIEALSVYIPMQEDINVKGSRTNIVGDLDSNEYTTADFEASPKKGNITLDLRYTDIIGERRHKTEQVFVNPGDFQDLYSEQESTPWAIYIIIAVILLIIIYWIYRRRKKKKK